MAKYQVGQELWIAPTWGCSYGYSATVKAVGRKWVTLDNRRRFDAKGSLPAWADDGRCLVYESQADCVRRHRLRNNWSNLVMHLRNRPMPIDMTTEKIIAAAELLGIDYEIVKGKETKDD